MTTNPPWSLLARQWVPLPTAVIEHAACAGQPPDVFFDPRSNHGPALELCRDCPARIECLAHALTHDEGLGVWGGTTPTTRRYLADQHRRRGIRTYAAHHAALTLPTSQETPA